MTNYGKDTRIENIKAPGTYSFGGSRMMSCGCSSSGSSCQYHTGWTNGYEEGIQIGVINEVNKQYEKGILHGVLLTAITVLLIELCFNFFLTYYG